MKPCLIKQSLKNWMVLFLLVCAIPAAAENSSLNRLEPGLENRASLFDLLQYAYETSPMILASRAAWSQSLEKIRVNTAYPDPELFMTYWPESMADDLDVKKFEIMLSQTLPFPGKLSAAGEAARAEAAVNRLDLDRSIRDTVTSIRESFHELSYIREAGRIAENNQMLLEQIRAISETAYATDRAVLMDVMKAQSQVAQSGYDTLLLQELEHTEITRLNALLNRPPKAAVGPLIPEPYRPVLFSLEDIFFLAEKNREEIRMAGQEILKSEAEAKVARFDTYPQFKLGLIYESSQPDDPMTSSTDMFGVQFGMSLPIRMDKNAGRIGMAGAAVEKTRAMAMTTVNETRALVRENYFRLQNAERLVFLYRDKLVPQALTSMETAEVWFREEQGTLTDYLETQAVWYNFQLALARASSDFGQYLARLEGLAGQSLTVEKDLP